MYKIKKEQRDAIVNYIAGSSLPAKDAIAIINTLNGLELLEEEKKK
jgi:hypothetical protein